MVLDEGENPTKSTRSSVFFASPLSSKVSMISSMTSIIKVVTEKKTCRIIDMVDKAAEFLKGLGI